MRIISFTCGPLQAQSYLVFDESRSDAILIDAGGDEFKILRIAQENGVNISAVLLTHGHFDHTGACKYLQDAGVKIYLHEKDKILVTTDEGSCGFGLSSDKFEPDVLLKGGENLSICGISIKVIHTPGHTNGGVCYVIDNNIFSGDTLFCGSYGRVDLGGDIYQLKDSIINKLFKLKGDFTVYPGHQIKTLLSKERISNPILYA